MLIEFTIGNFRSFNKKKTLSMLASSIHELEDTNVFKTHKHKLLKSAAVYGANSSGKSNLIRALNWMKNFVLKSSKDTQISERINIEPFRLSTECERQPSFFEVLFIINDTLYKYGFEVDYEKVHSEWLFKTPNTIKARETMLFTRETDRINVGSQFIESNGLQDKTRPNSLFLSVVAQFNGTISGQVVQWFLNLKPVSGLDDTGIIQYTIAKLMEESKAEKIRSFLTPFDLGFENIFAKEIPIEKIKFPQKISDMQKESLFRDYKGLAFIITSHSKYSNETKAVAKENFSLAENESAGTQKIVALSAPLVDILENGYILAIDELDARLHPLLTRQIIKMFNSVEYNRKNAQLIFATHDTNLLSNKYFRRDQIWFTEKNQFEATDLYSLAEIKVRNDASFEKDYILGKYGAIPFIGNFTSENE